MRFLAISKPTGQVNEQDQDDDMDAEIAHGRRLDEQGVLVQGYMDPTCTTAYFLLEAPDETTAQAHLATYLQVTSGISSYDVMPLIGLPAIQQSAEAHGQTLAAWWPTD